MTDFSDFGSEIDRTIPGGARPAPEPASGDAKQCVNCEATVKSAPGECDNCEPGTVACDACHIEKRDASPLMQTIERERWGNSAMQTEEGVALRITHNIALSRIVEAAAAHEAAAKEMYEALNAQIDDLNRQLERALR